MLTLFHGSFEPLLYGGVIFLGLLSMWYKFTHGKWAALIIEIATFTLIFRLHSGTMNGGFAATVAALLAGQIFPLMLRRRT